MPRQVGTIDKATVILMAAGLLLVAWLALLIAPLVTEDVGLSGLLEGLNAAMAAPFSVRWVEKTPRLLFLLCGTYAVSVMAWAVSRRRLKPFEEYGSARWGDPKQVNRKYAGKGPLENILLTNSVRLGLDSHIHRRNLNVLIVGGSGAGKTRFYAKPNVLQGNTSFIITDPKGEISRDTGELMKKLGYDVKVIDLINMNQSCC